MSSKVDSRIVEMRFDNKQFEQNVQTTMTSLNSLKKQLDFKGVEDGFSKITDSSRRVDMSPLTGAVETVTSKFSALEVMAVTALVNITNSAVNAGKQLISSLSTDQIVAGWDKYGQKTASVQTIMNATGKSIDEVNEYLDKLMWFSDETSYGFTDMTAALGQLTSSGGDIDKLIPLITGVANATAYAGKGANEFSRAMYNLNQSYSAGNLQYMDWKSLELAGIASKELKQTFIDTGIALGKIEEGEVTIANFGSTLSDKWADTEVMEIAFGKFGEMTEKAYEMVQNGTVETASEAYAILAEQYDGVSITAAKAAQEAKTFQEAIDATKDAVSSGWMKTFELIFGNYEEAKVLWTDLANSLWDVFASGAEARNELLSEWKELGGRDSLIQSFWNIWDNVINAINAVKEAFRDIFPSKTASELYDMTKKFENFTEKVMLSEEQLEGIKEIAKGLFSIIKILGSAIIGLVKPTLTLLTATKSASGIGAKIFDTIVNYSKLITELNESGKAASVFEHAGTVIANTIVKIVSFIKQAIEKIKVFASKVSEWVSIGKNFVQGITNGIKEKTSDLIEKVKEIGSTILNTIKNFLGIHSPSVEGIKIGGYFVEGIVEGFENWITNLYEKAKELGQKIIDGIKSTLNNETIQEILGNAKDVLDNAFNLGKDMGKRLIDGVKSIFHKKDSVTDLVKSDHSNMISIDDMVEPPEESKLMKFFEGVKTVVTKVWNVLHPILNAIGNIFVEIWKRIKPTTNEVNDGMKSLYDRLIEFVRNVNFENIIDQLYKLASTGLIASLAKLAWNLSTAVKSFSGFGDVLEDVGRSFNGILRGIKKTLNAVSLQLTAKALKTFAEALLILAAALLVICLIPEDKLKSSLKILAELAVGALAVMASFGAIGKFLGGGAVSAASMLVVATAILALALSLKILSKMSDEDIDKGLKTFAKIAIAYAGICIVTSSSSGSFNGILSMAIGIVAMALCIKILNKISDEEFHNGLVKMIQLVAIIAAMMVVSALSNKLSGKGLSGASVIVSMAAAILALCIAVKVLGNMDEGSFKQGLKGILALAGIISAFLLILTGISKIMSGAKFVSIISSLIGIVLAITVLAGVCQVLGMMPWDVLKKGLISSGIIVAEITVMLIALAVASKNINPTMLAALAEFIALFTLIGALFVIISKMDPEQFNQAMLGIAIVLGVVVGSLVAFVAGMATLSTLAPTIAPAIPVMNSLMNILLKLAVAMLAIGITIGILTLCFETLSTASDEAVATFSKNIVAIIAAIAVGLADAIVILLGSLDRIIAKLGESICIIVDVIVRTLATILEKLNENSELFSSILLDMLINILKVIRDKTNEITIIAIEIILEFVAGITEKLGDIIDAAFKLVISFINGLADAIRENAQAINEASWNLVDAIVGAIFNALGMGETYEKLKSFFSEMWEKIKIGFNKITEPVISKGKEIIEKICQGFADIDTEKIKQMVVGFWESVKQKFKQLGKDFKQIGYDILNGILGGLTGNLSKVGEAISSVGSDMVNAFKNFFGIHSPSRLMRDKVGRYVSEGLAEGISDYADCVTAAGEQVADDAVDSIQNGLNSTNGLLNGMFDGDPTIRPILDLSDIEAGAKRISGLLGQNQALSLAAEGNIGTNGSSSGIVINMTVNGAQGQDVKQLADIVAERINNSIARRANAWK